MIDNNGGNAVENSSLLFFTRLLVTAIDFRLSCPTKRLGEEAINYVLYDNKELANKNPVIINDCETFMEILKRT